MDGDQFAGALNVTRGAVDGGQFAGALNVAGRIDGWQIAGAANAAREVRGLQIGTFNVAGRVDGWQVGVVNISQDIDGVQLGLFNYSHTGLFNMSLWRDEVGLNHLTLISGSRMFYTSFSAARKDPADESTFALGIGAGRAYRRRRESPHSPAPAGREGAGTGAVHVRRAVPQPVSARRRGSADFFSLGDLEFNGGDTVFWPGLYVGLRYGR